MCYGGPWRRQTPSLATAGNDEYIAMPVNHEDDGMVWACSPALGYSVCVQGERARLYDPATGEYLRSLPESEADRRLAEAARLDAENRAAAAEAEAQRLRELVQRLKDGPAAGRVSAGTSDAFYFNSVAQRSGDEGIGNVRIQAA